MEEVAFKVSARAARLIGAENISNSESALIELIKNSYDADSENCIVYFEHLFVNWKGSLTRKEYAYLSSFNESEKYLSYFIEGRDGYRLKDNGDEETNKKVSQWVESACRIWIIDDGIGMNESVIKDYWMTIGTDNKEKSPVSKKFERIKSGAKGLGRFALDKLGKVSRVYMCPDPEFYDDVRAGVSVEWVNVWEDFLVEGKTLDGVKAKLRRLNHKNFHEGYVPSYVLRNKENGVDFSLNKYGVIICCDLNKEDWNKDRMLRLKKSLETLVPPVDRDCFNVCFLSNKFEGLNDKITSSVNYNYDYSVTAIVDSELKVSITLDRNEFEAEKFPESFFETEEFKFLGVKKEDFMRGIGSKSLSIRELMPSLSDDEMDALHGVGPFKFSFFFYKMARPTKDEKERLYYKDYNLQSRKSWNEIFGGVRIFRDNFRVRPYGEEGTAKDWLGLGDRSAVSPAGIGKKSKAWRVRPNQISGVIEISRVNNPLLNDKSSREGLQENKHFYLFKEIILSIVGVFEKDRSNVGYGIRQVNPLNYIDEEEQKEADKIAEKELANESSRDKKRNGSNEIKKLAKQYQKNKNQIKELQEEQKLLRSLATVGTVSTAFSHELKNIHGRLGARFRPIERAVSSALNNYDLNNKDKVLFESSRELLEIYKQQDFSIKDWINFSLVGMKKDKRRRRDVPLSGYFKKLQASWRRRFEDRKVNFSLSLEDQGISFNCFEIDLDCIFNNLFINSVEAFSQKKSPIERDIALRISIINSKLVINYQDSGPGLSGDIANPNEIFDCFFTTKRNEENGEEVGTGIGMWMVKSTVNEYKGKISINDSSTGFGLDMEFPV